MRAWPRRPGRVGRKPGRLGPFVDDYRAWLSEREYTPDTTRNMLKDGVLGRWMTEQGVESGRLDAAAIESFLVARRAAGQRRVPSLRAMGPPVSFLREAGVMAPDDGPEQLTALERSVGGVPGLAGRRARAGRDDGHPL